MPNDALQLRLAIGVFTTSLALQQTKTTIPTASDVIKITDYTFRNNRIDQNILCIEEEYTKLKPVMGRSFNKKNGNNTRLPDTLVTKVGQAKLAVDQKRVNRHQASSGNITYLVEDTDENTFVVSYKMVGRRKIVTCSCSSDGNCK